MALTPPLLPRSPLRQRAFRTPPVPGMIGCASGTSERCCSRAARSEGVRSLAACLSYWCEATMAALTLLILRHCRMSGQDLGTRSAPEHRMDVDDQARARLIYDRVAVQV